jgi:hypothetical protein
MSAEQIDRDRLTHRHKNLTLVQIERDRLTHRHENLTPEQIGRDRLRHLQENLTQGQQNAHRTRATTNRRRRPLHNIARQPFNDVDVDRHQLGRMTKLCGQCGTKLWPGESNVMCCGKGRIRIPPLEPLPPFLHDLFTGQERRCVLFRAKVRAYNSILFFTSVGAEIDHHLASGREGVFTYRLHGELTHRIGSLLPVEGDTPKFLQLYIYDTQNELQNRMAQMRSGDGEDQLDARTLQELLDVLREFNPYVTVFRQAIDIIRENAPVNLY